MVLLSVSYTSNAFIDFAKVTFSRKNCPKLCLKINRSVKTPWHRPRMLHFMHQSIPAAPRPPPATAGHFPALSVPGWGICKFCAARGPGICQPRGHSWAFDTHAVSYQKITTQRILLGKKADWLICQGQEKLKRFVKACSWFYACISSLLIEPELHSEIGSYRRESTFFGYWIKFLLILFEEHPFIFIKLFITYNLTALYYFNVNNFTSILKL